MFTGIVEELGRISRLRAGAEAAVLEIRAKKVLAGAEIGDSIAINGVCLTVTSLQQDGFCVDLSAETLRRTNLGVLHSGAHVNLERSLSFGGKMGGHFVQGHVDGTGAVARVMAEGEGKMIRFHAPSEVMRYVVPKGYIAVDGMSLTIVEPDEESFAVAFIPHTLAHTLAQFYRPGTTVNLEADVLGKYVEKFIAGRQKKVQGVTLALLEETGFAS
jgi:riboflavin synthase